MTPPSKKVRGHTLLRDGFRCLAGPSGCGGGLEWNHREASGHGGRGSKAPALTTADGVTLCEFHNNALEGSMQDLGLAMGWKIRRNRGSIRACEIPFFDRNDRCWYLPYQPRFAGDDGPYRTPLQPQSLADELLLVAGSLTRRLS